MTSPTLTSLPPEIHLTIQRHLLRNDEIILGLTCRHLYNIHARHWSSPLRSFTSTSFFAIVLANGGEFDEMDLMHWKIRNEILPRLREWVGRVGRECREGRGKDDEVEICVGCACYRGYAEDWTEGEDVMDVVDVDFRSEDSLEDEWRHIVKWGKLCKSCCSDLEKLRVAWKWIL